MSLTKEARDKLPAEHFAVPGKRKLPIHDETHTRLAWDMVNRTQGLTPEERKAARAHIKHRAHELGVDTADWHASAELTFEAMAVILPDVENHPNRAPFSGVLTRIDQDSDLPPGGSGGKKTYIPREVAEAALDSLANMAVDCDPKGSFDKHDPKFKIGVITSAEIVGNAIEIAGFFYANDFPDLWAKIQREKHLLGFSYECKVRILDQDADVWVFDRCVFTGAALLYKDLAAYMDTSLAAKGHGALKMTADELKEILAGALKPLEERIEAQAKDLNELKAKGASLTGPIVDQVKTHVDACNAAAAAMEAAGIGTHPTQGHAAVLRNVANHLAAEAVSGRTPHVYNEWGGAHVSAAAEKAEKAETDLKAAGEKVVKLEADLKASKDETASLTTKVADLEAAAKAAKPTGSEPVRKTADSVQVKTLLAKFAISEDQVGKLSVADADKALEAAGVKGQGAIIAKLRMRETGILAT